MKRAAAKVFKLSKEEEFTLVLEVKRRPILWNVKLKEYSRADLKADIWEQIANALGYPERGDAMQHRFKNMKDTFMTNLKKVRESKRSGVSTDSIYVPKWYLYESLSFLEPSCAQATSTSNFNLESGSDSGSSSSQTLTPLEREIRTFSSDGNSIPIYYDDDANKFMLIPSDTDEVESVNTTLSIGSPISSPDVQIALYPLVQLLLHMLYVQSRPMN